MDALDTLTRGNADFAAHRFASGLRIIPSFKPFVIGCVIRGSTRTGLRHRIGASRGHPRRRRSGHRGVLELALVRKLTQAAGGDFDKGWNFVVLQHTDCGIFRMQGEREGLADIFGVDADSLDAKEVGDPRAAVEVDVAALRDDRVCLAGCGARATSTTSRPDLSTPRWLPSERLTTSGHRRNR